MARTAENVETDDAATADSLDPHIQPVGPEDDGEDERPPEADEDAD